MRLLTTLTLVSALCMLPACGGTGGDGSEKTFQDIKPGTSQPEVERILGEPTDSTSKDGMVIDYWRIPDGQTYIVHYDKKGKVSLTEVKPASP